MFGFGPVELLLIFLAVLLLFGAKRLPEIAKGLGKGIKEFKGAMKETSKELKVSMDDDSEESTSNNQKKDSQEKGKSE